MKPGSSTCWATRLPAVGDVIELAPGVRWLRMPLPFALDHINLWLLRDRDEAGRAGWAIVDCGVANDATRAAWEQVFAHHLDGLPVLRVIVTHMHPDHIGNAQWLTERWGCRLWISATDWNAARVASQSTTGFGGDGAAAFFSEHGLVDPEALAKVRGRGGYYAAMVPAVPRQYRRLLDSQVLRIGDHAWRCYAGYGHAPEHISLYCAALGVLISGDMVLPRISTNISVIDLEPEADPLPLFLSSISRMRELPADTLVLPSHGKPFKGLHERVRQLVEHHDRHFEEGDGRLPCGAMQRVRLVAGAVSPSARLAPDDVRDGRGGWRTCMRWRAWADCEGIWMPTAFAVFSVA